MICGICWADAGRRQAAGDPRPKVEIYCEILESATETDRAHRA